MTNQPRAWDLQIIADLTKEITVIHDAIGDSAYTDMVRLPIGDSRPRPVSELKQIIDRKRDEIRSIQRQFPEYFAL